jgi:glycosidase
MGSTRVLAVAALALALPASALAAPKLLHDSFSSAYRSPGGAVPGGTRVTLRIRAVGAKAVTLQLFGAHARNVRMRRRGVLWSATIATPRAPALLGYSFKIRTAKRTLWYGDDFGDESDDVHQGGTGRASSVEAQPYQLTVYAPGFTTPAWLRDQVVYEIFADRFRNGDPSNDYCRAGSSAGCPTFYGSVQARLHPTWNEPVEDPTRSGVFNRDFFGGDLQGVQEKLGYLESLGFATVWLTPIFKARSNHRYDTEDYLQVDRGLGGDAAIASLASAANARGVRLILDGVFNHTSSDSVYFDRYHRYPDQGACESTTSPWRAWFEFGNNDIPCDEYTAFASLDTLPQLNHKSPAVRSFVESVVKYWDARGASGWRLDAADSVEDESFWTDFRTRAKAAAPEAPLIGEVWPDASRFLLGNRFDGVMDYRFRRAADGFVRQTDYSDSSGPIAALTPSRLDRSLAAIREDYPPQALASSFELIDSHDTVRALYTLKEPADSLAVAKERQRLAALLQFTYVGVPMVYYGDEAGIDAPGPDPFDRPPYPWTDASGDPSVYGPPDQSMLAYYAKLAAIRRGYAALRSGAFVKLLTDDAKGVYAFQRAGGATQPVTVVLNKSDRVESVSLLGSLPFVDLLTDRQFPTSTVDVPARGGLVLVSR